jgi:hypothetical protein
MQPIIGDPEFRRARGFAAGPPLSASRQSRHGRQDNRSSGKLHGGPSAVWQVSGEGTHPLLDLLVQEECTTAQLN